MSGGISEFITGKDRMQSKVRGKTYIQKWSVQTKYAAGWGTLLQGWEPSLPLTCIFPNLQNMDYIFIGADLGLTANVYFGEWHLTLVAGSPEIRF